MLTKMPGQEGSVSKRTRGLSFCPTREPAAEPAAVSQRLGARGQRQRAFLLTAQPAPACWCPSLWGRPDGCSRCRECVIGENPEPGNLDCFLFVCFLTCFY